MSGAEAFVKREKEQIIDLKNRYTAVQKDLDMLYNDLTAYYSEKKIKSDYTEKVSRGITYIRGSAWDAIHALSEAESRGSLHSAIIYNGFVDKAVGITRESLSKMHKWLIRTLADHVSGKPADQAPLDEIGAVVSADHARLTAYYNAHEGRKDAVTEWFLKAGEVQIILNWLDQVSVNDAIPKNIIPKNLKELVARGYWARRLEFAEKAESAILSNIEKHASEKTGRKYASADFYAELIKAAPKDSPTTRTWQKNYGLLGVFNVKDFGIALEITKKNLCGDGMEKQMECLLSAYPERADEITEMLKSGLSSIYADEKLDEINAVIKRLEAINVESDAIKYFNGVCRGRTKARLEDGSDVERVGYAHGLLDAGESVVAYRICKCTKPPEKYGEDITRILLAAEDKIIREELPKIGDKYEICRAESLAKEIGKVLSDLISKDNMKQIADAALSSKKWEDAAVGYDMLGLTSDADAIRSNLPVVPKKLLLKLAELDKDAVKSVEPISMSAFREAAKKLSEAKGYAKPDSVRSVADAEEWLKEIYEKSGKKWMLAENEFDVNDEKAVERLIDYQTTILKEMRGKDEETFKKTLGECGLTGKEDELLRNG